MRSEVTTLWCSCHDVQARCSFCGWRDTCRGRNLSDVLRLREPTSLRAGAMSLSALSELMSPNRAGEASSSDSRGGSVWTPSLPVALAVFALFLALELLQRWSVLRPVRVCGLSSRRSGHWPPVTDPQVPTRTCSHLHTSTPGGARCVRYARAHSRSTRPAKTSRRAVVAADFCSERQACACCSRQGARGGAPARRHCELTTQRAGSCESSASNRRRRVAMGQSCARRTWPSAGLATGHVARSSHFSKHTNSRQQRRLWHRGSGRTPICCVVRTCCIVAR